MDKIKIFFNKYSLLIFGLITIFIMLFRIPFWDETHAFNISCLKLKEIFYLTRIEGHGIFWYLILKPFNNVKFYPYSMFLINWIFCILALLVLWKKSPFDTLIKVLITFSFPFLNYFAPVARCYSLGILFLFLACSYYPKRFKKPYHYSFMLFLCANTSVVMALCCFYFVIFYVFELFSRFKRKMLSKNVLIKTLSIFVLLVLTLFLQFFKTQTPYRDNSINFIFDIMNYLLIPNGLCITSFLFRLTIFISFYYSIFYLFKKSKKALLFILAQFITLSSLFIFIYYGNWWNYLFYYIYFIAFCWIFYKKLFKNKVIKIFYTVIFILALFPSSFLNTGNMKFVNESKSLYIANYIYKNENYKNAKLYVLEWWNDIAPASLAYLDKKNIKIYDVYNRDRKSFESIKDIFKLAQIEIDLDEFIKFYNENKKAYILTTNIFLRQNFKDTTYFEQNDDYIFETKKGKYLFKKVDEVEKYNLKIYQIFCL